MTTGMSAMPDGLQGHERQEHRREGVGPAAAEQRLARRARSPGVGGDGLRRGPPPSRRRFWRARFSHPGTHQPV